MDVSLRSADSPSQSLARPRTAQLAPIPRWSHRLGLLLVTLQVLYALVIPIKNVVMITNPIFRMDSIETEIAAYNFSRTGEDEGVAQSISGAEIKQLLQEVMAIAFENKAVREHFEQVGSFDLDRIVQLLDPKEFYTISRYYALAMQASEFPGSVFTPRPRLFGGDARDVSQDAVALWVKPTVDADPWLLTLSCSSENARLQGTRCFQGGTSYPCYDFPVPGEQRTYESVNLDSVRAGSGLANNVGLLYVIEIFHATMSTLFSTKSWQKTLESQQYVTDNSMALENGFTSVFRQGIPMILEKNAMTFSLRIRDLGSRTLESCVLTNLIANSFYTKAYVVQLIEAKVRATDYYYTQSIPTLALPTDRIQAIVEPIFQSSLLISSGAHPKANLTEKGTKILGGWSLTSVKRATARAKLDRKLDGDGSFGSNMRMLQMMAQYPDYYSYYEHQTITDSAGTYDQMQFKILGGAMSGLNTFKRDWWGNTMQVYRLAEIPADPGDKRLDTWWDDELHYSRWFQRLENSSDAPYFALDKFIDVEATGVVLNDNPLTRCHRAFYKTLTKIVWLSMISASELPTYLVFMGNVNGGARQWFLTSSKKLQLYGESFAYTRYGYSFSALTDDRKDDGSAWVIVPLMQAMLQYFGRDETLRVILAEFNSSFSSLVNTEYGLVHFSDSAQCRVGFERNGVSADTNTIQKIMEKFYPSIQRFFEDAISTHPTLYNRMKTDLLADGVEMVTIPREILLGSPSTPRKVGLAGSPVYWRPTALTAGLMKFWPPRTPPPNVVDLFRQTTVCYRTLELRYLNESTRCWVEPSSISRGRTAYNSERLRYVVWSNWSISLVLNFIAILIAIQYIWRFAKAYRVTRFRCVSVWVAMQLNFQGFGVLSYPQIVFMTISVVPLLISYHLPADEVFMPVSGMEKYPKLLRDIIVCLSVTWFNRLGYETLNQFVHVHSLYRWANYYRLRMASIFLVFVLRLAVPDRIHDAEYEVWKFMWTYILSFVLGVSMAYVPVYFERQQRRGVMPRMNTMVKKEQHVIVAQLKKEGLPLNHYGLLGFTKHGWSLTGLMIEGWEVLERKHKNDTVLLRGRCKVRLPRDEDGEIRCLL